MSSIRTILVVLVLMLLNQETWRKSMPTRAGDAEIKSLVEAIDKDVDELHADITPSVLKLIEKGLPAARAVLDLLDAPELLTRKRAQRVLEGVVMRRHGWKAGQGYTDPDGQQKTQDLLADNGNYQASAARKARRQAIEKWRRWLGSQQ